MALLPAPVAPTVLRHALRLLLVAAVVLSSHAGSLADEKPKSKTKTKADGQDTIQIIPAAKVPAGGFQASPAKGSSAKPSAIATKLASAQAAADAYRRVYRSIPFNRRLSLTNPGYRHDATMELLTGNARPADSRSASAEMSPAASSRSDSAAKP